jgi:hypothetical protein
MSETPVPRDPGQDDNPSGVPAGPGDRPRLGSPDWRLVPQSPDWPEWMDDDAHAEDEDSGDPDEYQDPDNAPPPGLDDTHLEALLAESGEITADQARAAEAAARSGHAAVLAAVGAIVTGRRGPGMPGSAQSFPGEDASPAAGIASGMPLDAAPGSAPLASFLSADTTIESSRTRAGRSSNSLTGRSVGRRRRGDSTSLNPRDTRSDRLLRTP